MMSSSSCHVVSWSLDSSSPWLWGCLEATEAVNLFTCLGGCFFSLNSSLFCFFGLEAMDRPSSSSWWSYLAVWLCYNGCWEAVLKLTGSSDAESAAVPCALGWFSAFRSCCEAAWSASFVISFTSGELAGLFSGRLRLFSITSSWFAGASLASAILLGLFALLEIDFSLFDVWLALGQFKTSSTCGWGFDCHDCWTPLCLSSVSVAKRLSPWFRAAPFFANCLGAGTFRARAYLRAGLTSCWFEGSIKRDIAAPWHRLIYWLLCST